MPSTLKLLTRHTRLDNGLFVLSTFMPHAFSTSINVLAKIGSRNDPKGQSGISHVIEHLLFKGTHKRPSPIEISGTIENVGGILNASTEQEVTTYWSKIPKTYLYDALDLKVDMLRNSKFDDTDISSEIQVVIEEQNMSYDNPIDRVAILLDKLMWSSHPLGQEIGGSRKSVSNLTRRMILNQVHGFYIPQNIVISVAGKVNHNRLVETIDSLTKDWDNHKLPVTIPFEESQKEPKHCIEYRKIEQAHINLGLPGLNLSHPDKYSLRMLSVILGEGMSSRLFVEVREKKGLAYDIHSETNFLQDCGTINIYAGVDPRNTLSALITIIKELSRIRNSVTDQELQKAKQLCSGLLTMEMEDTRSVSSWAGMQQLTLGKILDVNEVIKKIDSVTVEDIHRTANNFLLGEKLNLAIVGPIKENILFQNVLHDTNL